MSPDPIRSAYNVGWHAGKYRSGWHAHREVRESTWKPEEIDAYWRGFNDGRKGLSADSRRGRPAPDYDPHIDYPERYTGGKPV